MAKRSTPSNLYQMDPEDLAVPDGFPAPEPGTGEVVALLADEGPRAAGWAAGVAVRLASEWSDDGARVLLVDGDIEHSPLGQLLDVGGEGVADFLFYGASPERISQTPDGRGFRFAPAGTVVADPADAYQEPRWRSLFDAYRSVGTVLLLYLPAETAGVGDLAVAADRVIRLMSSAPEVEEEGEVVLLQGPSASEAPTPEVAPAPIATESGTAAAPDSGPAHRSGPRLVQTGPAGPSRRSGGRLVLLLVLIVVLAVLVAGWLGYLTIPGLTGTLFPEDPSGLEPILAWLEQPG